MTDDSLREERRLEVENGDKMDVEHNLDVLSAAPSLSRVYVPPYAKPAWILAGLLMAITMVGVVFTNLQTRSDGQASVSNKQVQVDSLQTQLTQLTTERACRDERFTAVIVAMSDLEGASNEHINVLVSGDQTAFGAALAKVTTANDVRAKATDELLRAVEECKTKDN